MSEKRGKKKYCISCKNIVLYLQLNRPMIKDEVTYVDAFERAVLKLGNGKRIVSEWAFGGQTTLRDR
ncbi:MAG: hypothetical protein IKP66_01910 [Lachnospiraceae bacterium]|nr:hypothetical protein [Lachnospiraceae bacterium]